MKYLKRFNESQDDIESKVESLMEDVDVLLLDFTDQGITYKVEYIDGFYEGIYYNLEGNIKVNELVSLLRTLEDLIESKYNDMALTINVNSDRKLRTIDDVENSENKIIDEIDIIFIL